MHVWLVRFQSCPLEQSAIAVRSTQNYVMVNDIVVHTDGEGRRRKHIMLQCETCKTEFPKPLRFAKKKDTHYCSPKCGHIGRKVSSVVECDFCKKPHERKPSRATKSGLVFCSRRCKELAQTAMHQLLSCGNEFGGAAGYRERALRYYGSKCEWCEYAFEKLLDVHHIDRNRQNGAIENLMVLCVLCHTLDTRNMVRVGDSRELVIAEVDHREQLEQHFGSRGVLLETLLKPRRG